MVLYYSRLPRSLRDPEFDFTFDICGVEVATSDLLKYLGIMVGAACSFQGHFDYTLQKARKAVMSFHPIFRNTKGYDNKARKIILDGVASVLLKYCSIVFVHRLQLKKHVEAIRRTDRFMRIFIARSYRDVSYLPLTVITATPPLDYLIEKRTIMYLFRRKEVIDWRRVRLSEPRSPEWREWSPAELAVHLDKCIQQKWQEEWNNCEKGRWTKELLPVEEVGKPDNNFYLTQALSGHGSFNEYLHRRKRRSTPLCRCGKNEQTPDHVFKHFRIFEEGRPPTLDMKNNPETKTVSLEATVRTLWDLERRGQAIPIVVTTDTTSESE